MQIYANTSDDRQLTIHVAGSVDSTNAAEAETQILAFYQKESVERLVLDLQELTYISSSGLRVLLKLRKMEQNMRLINVSAEVHEILELTGFVNLFPVSRALRTIEIHDGKELGAGGQGRVLRLNDDTIVKLYHPGVRLEDVEREQDYAKKAFVMGIPTAIPFDIVRCGDQYGLIFELVNADTLANHLNAHPEQLPEYAVKYADMLRELHSLHVQPGALSQSRELYRKRIEGLRAFLTDEEVETVHRINNAIPEGDTVVHGDFHPGNIMVQNGELILIDMADLTMGHPLYDLGSMSLTHHITRDERIESITHMKAELVRDMWKRFLSRYLQTQDAQIIGMTEKKADVVGLMKMASALSFSLEVNEIMGTIIALLREQLLKNADQLIRLLSM